MPRVAVWLVRAALIHLALGFTLGALLLFNKGVAVSPEVWRLRPAHLELLLIGWTVQLVMGVAYWIFPRFGVPAAARRLESAAWGAVVSINLGVGLVGFGAVLGGLDGLVLAGRVLEALAVMLMVVTIWPRVRPGLSAM